MSVRAQAQRVIRRLRSHEQATLTGDITHEPYPSASDPIDDFSVCAVVKTWMDEDVIEATVRSAMAQGVDFVYIVDNGSTDDTLAIAEAAGATVAEVYRTKAFDGRLAQTLMNAVSARESLRNGAPHVWWLYLDTDEFPEGPGGLTIREYLASLDRRFRLVGASYVNHFPSGKPEYLSGFHPIDLQPLCYDFEPARWPPCAWGHWKHPLQRFDMDGQFILSNDGSHTAFSNDSLIAPTGGIVTHHFQYRDEAYTRAKLELTCGPGSNRTALHEATGFDGFVRRRASLDAVYAGRWADVDTIPIVDPNAARHPKPWTGMNSVRRWYQLDELAEARRRWAESAKTEPTVSAQEQ
jgi:glycosyltransferase involved in cell wall biosynthesis